MENFTDLLQDIVSNPLQSLFTVLGLVLIESLLSVDNAAVLATMVKVLPTNQQKRALRYGIIGAYVMRGLSILLVSFLINMDQYIGAGHGSHPWQVVLSLSLKAFGGAYLLYLAYKNFFGSDEEDEQNPKGWYGKLVKSIGLFWATVCLVEVMDMVFSVDNIFAAVAYTKNILLVIFGVFIGILAMRFIAQGFVVLMQKYPFLENAAYVVIAFLGFKLLISAICLYFVPQSSIAIFLESKTASVATSVITVLIFFLPILFMKHKDLEEVVNK
ncbi:MULTISPECIES: TerC family protein [Chitinophagaceae]